MPTGIGLEIVIVIGLLLLLLAGLVVGRLRAQEARPEGAVETAARPEALGARVRRWLGGGKPTEDDWKALEEELLKADAGPAAAREIVTRVEERFRPGDDAEALLLEELAGMFEGDAGLDLTHRPAVIMVVGVNGTGKTTTVGKLAHRLVDQGRLVALAASDTFRAAAIPQLAEWAERAGADLVSQERGSDAGAVAFDAYEAATARGHDVLIVDTAGRLHSRKPLMDELAKVKRVLEKAAGEVDEVLLVLDATTGQNGLAQAKAFVESVGVTGVAVAKLDGTAKAGAVLAIREELGIPVKLIGTGEQIGDLQAFDAKRFAAGLVRG
ncbi:MAG TPA: signal recognition particle-docking protein FtsY [Actinomycetota bacterium]|jgi:fused signal recognition particle receptor|nr:signal recognition particle-docking protein FtsY [Actinomycetota bacterium]